MLAARLRAEAGGELDDDAIIAVSEATGAPADYVRLAIRSVPHETKKPNLIQQLRSSFLAFDPDKRQMLTGALIGLSIGVFSFLDGAVRGDSGLPEILAAVMYIAGAWNAMFSRNVKTAIFSGALAGGVGQLALAFFGFIQGAILPYFQTGSNVPMFLLLTFLGAIVGGLSFEIFRKNRAKIGFKDPVAERHRLLQQLLDIQKELNQDERFVTFISVDMAGSTKIKSQNDPLAVEFTFNEFHEYIRSVATKHGGQIHSTAGDGVTIVFDRVQNAFQAGKSLQAGLFEFNTFRNKLRSHVEMRAAMHTGSVLAPGQVLTKVNYAQVIDVAAHLQKAAPVGAFVVSQDSATYLGGSAKVGEEKIEIEETTGYVWWPKQKSLVVAQAATELNN